MGDRSEGMSKSWWPGRQGRSGQVNNDSQGLAPAQHRDSRMERRAQRLYSGRCCVTFVV